MAAASTDSGQGSAKITPEVLQEMLQYYNLSHRDFINAYNIQPLVYIPELPYSAKSTFVIMYVVIFVLALAGNSLVIYIIVKKRTIQTATDIFSSGGQRPAHRFLLHTVYFAAEHLL